MKRLALLLLMLATPAAAQVAPASPTVDPRVQTLQYDPNQVVRLNVAMNYQLTVIFSPDEQVENVAIGDSDAWQATLNGRGDALFLKPTRQNANTNMTVITDDRVYNFELAASYGPAADAPFTVRFKYADTAAEPSLTVQPRPGEYRLGGARSIRPKSISDDGVRTYIEWPAEQAFPAVFAVDDRGEEVLLDGYVRDGRYVVDAVHQTLVFRLERQTARASRVRTRNRG